MIIQSSNLSFQSARVYRQSTSGSSSVSILKNLPDLSIGKEPENSDSKKQFSGVLERYHASKSGGIQTVRERLDSMQQMHEQMMNYLLRLIFGDKSRMDDYGWGDSSASDYEMQTTRYESRFVYSENETTGFSAAGTVKTADGRSLDINVNLIMSRAFTQATSQIVDYTRPVLCDPLVINLNASPATVSDQTFFFDLDADGNEEELSMLNAGSGYLALDKNGDGVINDGSELFGVKSGNGFADLAAYDDDGNGWIDEADAIFSKLKIWTVHADGTRTLTGLGKAGVGAIYLGSSDTEFSLNAADNSTNAVIRKTGLFLYENGAAGTMQQVDLAIHPKLDAAI